MKPIKNESPFPKVQLPRVPYTLKWNLFFKLCSRIANAHFSSFFNPLQMNKFATGLASVLILSVAGWGVFQFGITTTYQDHVSNAQAALTELDTFTQTGTVALAEPVFQLIPTAHAEGDEVINRYVRDLVSTVVHETELAIEKVEDSRDPVDVEEALDIIDELQDDTVDVLVDVVDVVDDDELLEDVIDAIETTEEDNAEVEQAIEEVEEAIENGDEEVVIDVETDIDTDEDLDPEDDDDEDESNKEEKAQNRYREAKALYDEVRASLGEGEVSQKMQGKLERIEAALEGCGEDATAATECKSGKIKGLSTALGASIRNEVRKEEKAQEKKQKGKDEEVIVDDEDMDPEEIDADENDETVIDTEDTEDEDEAGNGNGNGNKEMKEEKVSNKGEDKNIGKDKENKGKGKTEDVEEDEEVAPTPAPIPSPTPELEPAIDELVRETASTADTSAEEEKGNSGQGKGKNK